MKSTGEELPLQIHKRATWNKMGSAFPTEKLFCGKNIFKTEKWIKERRKSFMGLEGNGSGFSRLSNKSKFPPRVHRPMLSKH
ncbi:hypothetical protein Ddc_06479 [Ditylenchus destructor]|nr:hypothetical protein Ddc_06479 [Ditylenchus destructor]